MKTRHLSAAVFLSAIALSFPHPAPSEEPAPPASTPGDQATPANPESSPEAISLFDGKALGDWKRVDSGGSGEASVDAEKGTLDVEFGESLSGVVYQKAAALPTTNYEISLQAMRVDGSDFFCGLTFPVGDLKTCATLIVGGWGGGVTGISSINGLDASENETGDYFKIEDEKWYHIRLRVTPEKIQAWIGEEKIIDVGIEGKKISMRPGDIELFMPLSLTTFQTSSSFKDITVTPIKPEGEAPVPAE